MSLSFNLKKIRLLLWVIRPTTRHKFLRLDLARIEGDFPWSCGSAVWQNKIYFFGGLWASEKYLNITDQLFVFDQLSFKELAPLPDKRNVKGKFVKGKLYAFGGRNQKLTFNDILMYSPETNSWSTVGYLPHPVSNYAIVADENLIYINGFFNNKGVFGIYNPELNMYKEYSTNLTLQDGGLFKYENKIYYFRGSYADDPKNLGNRLYVFDLALLPNE
jgi:hypothetical protein